MKITVITATLNSERYLEECIAAAASQGDVDFEHIVVDGGSSDSTLALARQHQHVRVIELPGSGIYEAWNAGLGVATGDLIGICNSDDYYALNTFTRACGAIVANPDVWMVSGRGVQFRRAPTGEQIVVAKYCDKTPNRFHIEDVTLFGSAINARFLTRKLIAKIGRFDTRYRLAADCSYMIEIALLRLPVATVDEVFCFYRSHEGSRTLGANLKESTLGLDEKLKVGREYLRDARLQDRERTYLRRSMAVQLNATIVDYLRAGRWRTAIGLLSRLRGLGFTGALMVPVETGRLVLRYLTQRMA